MFDSPAFDVAIGLVFLYIVLALVCSTVNEAIATAIGLRARYLETGLLNLLSGSVSETPAGIATAEKFYGHPLVQGLIRPRRAPRPAVDVAAARRGPWSRLRRLLAKPPYPSYVPSRTFVVAISDIANEAKAALEEAQGDEADKARARVKRAEAGFERSLASIPNAQLSEALLALYRSAGGDAVRFQHAAEEWFDDAMERVSGWYKRRVHVLLAVIAAVVVVVLNADTLAAGRVLWRDDAVRTAIVKEASDTAKGTLDDVALENAVKKLDLPLGWNLSVGDGPTQLPDNAVAWVQKLVGLLLTIAAIQLGAPFWFDLLSKIVRVRATGAPPPASDAVRRGEGEETRRGPVGKLDEAKPETP
jgi:hypothetical protein